MTGWLATPVALPVVLALVLGLVWGLATPAILRELSEPPDAPEDIDVKVPYASLATWRFAVTVATLTALAVVIPTVSLSSPILLPPWLVLATLGVLLAAIDARTTWLPLSLTRAAWIAMAVALGLCGLLGGWSVALRGVVGFCVAGAIFGAIWLVTRGGFGFGDVRYAPLVGAATATVSWTLLAWALVLGSLVGAVLGLVRLARRRRGAFAYAPAILAGGYLAVALARLTT